MLFLPIFAFALNLYSVCHYKSGRDTCHRIVCYSWTVTFKLLVFSIEDVKRFSRCRHYPSFPNEEINSNGKGHLPGTQKELVDNSGIEPILSVFSLLEISRQLRIFTKNCCWFQRQLQQVFCPLPLWPHAALLTWNTSLPDLTMFNCYWSVGDS